MAMLEAVGEPLIRAEEVSLEIPMPKEERFAHLFNGRNPDAVLAEQREERIRRNQKPGFLLGNAAPGDATFLFGPNPNQNNQNQRGAPSSARNARHDKEPEEAREDERIDSFRSSNPSPRGMFQPGMLQPIANQDPSAGSSSFRPNEDRSSGSADPNPPRMSRAPWAAAPNAGKNEPPAGDADASADRNSGSNPNPGGSFRPAPNTANTGHAASGGRLASAGSAATRSPSDLRNQFLNPRLARTSEESASSFASFSSKKDQEEGLNKGSLTARSNGSNKRSSPKGSTKKGSPKGSSKKGGSPNRSQDPQREEASRNQSPRKGGNPDHPSKRAGTPKHPSTRMRAGTPKHHPAMKRAATPKYRAGTPKYRAGTPKYPSTASAGTVRDFGIFPVSHVLKSQVGPVHVLLPVLASVRFPGKDGELVREKHTLVSYPFTCSSRSRPDPEKRTQAMAGRSM